MIDAIAVRQIASTSKAGAADAGETPADSMVNMINRQTKGMGEFPLLPSILHVQPDSASRVRPQLQLLSLKRAP
jgi:hypothetical protein